ncbi:hypothetical protein [Paenibacillus kandeliae]|uniref:hypothetical protein n=1 Tax=Paenibacillus kandeliae TaxID=3231269 RepID=UPI0034591915
MTNHYVSSSFHLGSAFFPLLTMLPWILSIVLMICGLYFLIKIGNRLIKLIDLSIDEKKRNRYIANFPSNDDQTK